MKIWTCCVCEYYIYEYKFQPDYDVCDICNEHYCMKDWKTCGWSCDGQNHRDIDLASFCYTCRKPYKFIEYTTMEFCGRCYFNEFVLRDILCFKRDN